MSPQRRVLVVDDDRMVLTSIVAALEVAGFHVWGANSGEEAFRLAGALRPDVVVTDLRMPGMDGLTLLEQLRDAGHPADRLLLYSAAPPADRPGVDLADVQWIPKAPGHRALLDALTETTDDSRSVS